MTLANVLHAMHPNLLQRKARHPYPSLRTGAKSFLCRAGEHDVCRGCYCKLPGHPLRHDWEGR
jgi:hypothetical protein